MPQEYGTFFSPNSPLAAWLRPKKSEDALEAGSLSHEDKSGAPSPLGGIAPGSPTLFHNTPTNSDGSTPSFAAPESVLLFGLSANPPTGQAGHAGIVKFLKAQNQWDEIWVLPVYKHMHVKNRLLVDFEDRFQMCRLNFLPPPSSSSSITASPSAPAKSRTRVRVTRLEKEVADHYIEEAAARGKGPEAVKVGTIDVVMYAKERLPNTEFSLVLGTDTFNDMKKGKWKRGRELLDLVSVVIVSRPGVSYALQDDDVTNPRLHFFNVPSLGEVSSTAVRKTTDLRLLREVLEPRVLEYIRERGLYALGRVEGGMGWGAGGGGAGGGRTAASSFYSYTRGKRGGGGGGRGGQGKVQM
ncbi:hypothetical protein VYU27_002388, partial [Nannochloropsis oceanica]